jgi:hypothetical protein
MCFKLRRAAKRTPEESSLGNSKAEEGDVRRNAKRGEEKCQIIWEDEYVKRAMSRSDVSLVSLRRSEALPCNSYV